MVFSTVNYNDYSLRIIISPFYTRARALSHTHTRTYAYTFFISHLSNARRESYVYIYIRRSHPNVNALRRSSSFSSSSSSQKIILPFDRCFFRFFSLCLVSIQIRLIHPHQVLRHHRSHLHVFSSLI